MPRKRSRKQTPRIRSWPASEQAKLLGFTGYKAGMTHVLAFDGRKTSPSSGLEIAIPATVIDAPPIFILGIRVYAKGYGGKEAKTDVWAPEIPKDLEKRLNVSPEKKLEKKLEDLAKSDNIADIYAIACTQPTLSSVSKKTPDVMEIAIGGDVPAKLAYAKQILGKTVSVKDVFSENAFTDVCAVTKGKGFKGPVKRWGISIQPRKSTKGRRHGGTGGAWTPKRKLWTEPQAGQVGYHTRTEYNKLILKIGEDGRNVTPKGGFLKYGLIKGEYVIVEGSVPGPAKRLVRINAPKRPSSGKEFTVNRVSTTSRQGL